METQNFTGCSKFNFNEPVGFKLNDIESSSNNRMLQAFEFVFSGQWLSYSDNLLSGFPFISQ